MKKKLVLTLVTLIVTLFIFNDTYAQGITPKKDAKKNLWGYVNSSDKWVVKPKYEEAREFAKMPNGKMQALVTSKGLKGYIDEAGKVLGAGIVFEQMTPLEGNAMFVTVKGKKGVANYDGVYLVKPEAEAVDQFGNDGWFMTIKGKKGLLKNDGTWILQPLYSDIDTSLDDYFLVLQGGKAGIFDRQGTIKLAPKEYTKVEPFGKYWKVYKGKKVGLYDLSANNLLVKPEFSDLLQPIDMTNGRVFVVSNQPGKWGAIDSRGKTLAKIKYSAVQPIASPEALLLFENNKPQRLHSLENKKNYKIRKYNRTRTGKNTASVDLEYSNFWENHSLTLHELPDGSLYEALTGEVKKLNQYTAFKGGEKVKLFRQDGSLFMDTVVNDYGPLDINGWTAFSTFAIDANDKIHKAKICDNSALLVENQPGIYNLALSGNSLTDFPVTDAKQLVPGVIAVYSNNKWGVASGSKMIHPIDLDARPPVVKLNSTVNYVVVDSNLYLPNGKVLTGNRIEENNGYYVIHNNDLVGLVDSSFSEILPAEYDEIEYVKVFEDNGYSKKYGYKLIKNGIASLINLDGSAIISEDKGYSDIEVVDKGRDSGGYLACPTLYIVTKNGKKGIENPKGGGLDPVYDAIDISHERLIDKLLIIATKGNTKLCYAFKLGALVDFTDKEPVKSGTPIAEMSYSDGVVGVGISDIYLPNDSYIDVIVEVFNKNGTKAKSPSGYPLIVEDSRNLVKGFGSYIEFFLFDYYVPRHTRKEFYAKVTLKDSKGRKIPLKGKTTQSFYIQRY